MEKYLFFSDIDGTLLRGASGIHPSVKQAAKRFTQAGGLLTLCTGRSHISTGWVARELDIRLPCILFTGAALYDFSAKHSVWTRPLENAVLDAVEAAYTQFPQISLQVYTEEEVFILRKNDHLEAYGVEEELQAHISTTSQVRGDILKIVMACKDAPLLQQCGEKLFASRGYQFAFASRHFAEVVAPGAGKAAAMQALSARLHVKPCNTFAAGDGMTDLPLLQAAGYAFAPVDAAEPVRMASDMQIPACEAGGMAMAFDRAIQLMTIPSTYP